MLNIERFVPHPTSETFIPPAVIEATSHLLKNYSDLNLRDHLLGLHPPSWPEISQNLADWDIGFQHQAVGHDGDFGDVWFPESDHQNLCLAIGDAADHSPYSAFVARLTLSQIKEHLHPNSDLIEITHQINQILYQHLNPFSEFDSLFTTALFGNLNLTNGEFKYIRLGHSYPMVTNRNGQTREIPYRSSPSLHLHESLIGVDLDINTITLHPGDTLLVTTDGIYEAFSPPPALTISEGGSAFQPSTDYFGWHAILDLVTHGVSNGYLPQRICNRLVDAVLDHQKHRPHRPHTLQDDVTVMAFQRALA